MSSESTRGKGVADQGPTRMSGSSSTLEVVDFLRASFQQILIDQENALKVEIENVKKANESAQNVREIEEWKMKVNREMEELKAEKKEVEERLKASEERYVLLERRVARIEENVAYVAAMLLRKDAELAAAASSTPNKEVAGKSRASSSYLNLNPHNVGRRAWMDQNEMCLAFVNDPELCVSALCALYRQLVSAPLANDELGVVLAKYLIDGHPENKLNRPFSEITKVAAEESTRLALKYSAQLFRIYSSGEDPFFSHNSTTSRPGGVN